MMEAIKKAWAACTWEARVIVASIAALTAVVALAKLIADHLAP